MTDIFYESLILTMGDLCEQLRYSGFEIVIPESIHEERIRENCEVFEFQLEAEDMELLDSLNENLRPVF
jgi:diketogulonate reductase-like aldo/keto reductase